MLCEWEGCTDRSDSIVVMSMFFTDGHGSRESLNVREGNGRRGDSRFKSENPVFRCFHYRAEALPSLKTMGFSSVQYISFAMTTSYGWNQARKCVKAYV